MKIQDSKKIFLIFAQEPQKPSKTPQKPCFAIFLWFGSTIAQSCKPILMRFIAIGSEFSGLPGYQLTFFDFCPGTSKYSLKMAFSDTQCFFWYPAANSCEFYEVPGKKSKKVSRKTFSPENSEPITINRIKIGLKLWATVLPNHKKIF